MRSIHIGQHPHRSTQATSTSATPTASVSHDLKHGPQGTGRCFATIACCFGIPAYSVPHWAQTFILAYVAHQKNAGSCPSGSDRFHEKWHNGSQMRSCDCMWTGPQMRLGFRVFHGMLLFTPRAAFAFSNENATFLPDGRHILPAGRIPTLVKLDSLSTEINCHEGLQSRCEQGKPHAYRGWKIDTAGAASCICQRLPELRFLLFGRGVPR
jgi:hypothetical protein